MELLSQPG